MLDAIILGYYAKRPDSPGCSLMPLGIRRGLQTQRIVLEPLRSDFAAVSEDLEAIKSALRPEGFHVWTLRFLELAFVHRVWAGWLLPEMGTTPALPMAHFGLPTPFLGHPTTASPSTLHLTIAAPTPCHTKTSGSRPGLHTTT
jgi:hypothetical protein